MLDSLLYSLVWRMVEGLEGWKDGEGGCYVSQQEVPFNLDFRVTLTRRR